MGEMNPVGTYYEPRFGDVVSDASMSSDAWHKHTLSSLWTLRLAATH